MATFGKKKVRKGKFGRHRFGETKDYTKDADKTTNLWRSRPKASTTWRSQKT